MSTNIVRRTVDLNNLPPLTQAQKAELAALASRPESEIDYSDIPPLSEEFWVNARRGCFEQPARAARMVKAAIVNAAIE